tara:strand:- start:95 stop:274 length:180 start_codon:yes stop_codon:yes gene_type:complete
MLKDFSIKKSIFSWNTTIQIIFVKKNDKYITRKFYFSLLNRNQKQKVISSLDKILTMNE